MRHDIYEFTLVDQSPCFLKWKLKDGFELLGEGGGRLAYWKESIYHETMLITAFLIVKK